MSATSSRESGVDAISLAVFRSLFASVAEEMGVTLQRASFSANVKERLDFSCAVFDAQGRMVAQAAHIRGIDKVDARVQRGVGDLDPIGLVGRITKVHRSQANARYLKPAIPQRHVLHFGSPFIPLDEVSLQSKRQTSGP